MREHLKELNMRRAKKRMLVRKVLGRIVRKAAKRIGNKKFYKRGLRTKKINKAHSQRGGFSL